MDTRRSFYLASRKDDFAEPAADLSTIDFTDIPYVVPANDNASTKDRLSARCGALLRRLIALHRIHLAFLEDPSTATSFDFPTKRPRKS